MGRKPDVTRLLRDMSPEEVDDLLDQEQEDERRSKREERKREE